MEQWTGDADKRAFTEFVNEQVRGGLGWPNAFFIPADPFWVVFADDDGVFLDILHDIEEGWGISSDIAIALAVELEKSDLRLTYGEWIDRLWTLRQAASDEGVEQTPA